MNTSHKSHHHLNFLINIPYFLLLPQVEYNMQEIPNFSLYDFRALEEIISIGNDIQFKVSVYEILPNITLSYLKLILVLSKFHQYSTEAGVKY